MYYVNLWYSVHPIVTTTKVDFIIPILWVSLNGIKWLPQGLSVNKWQSRNSTQVHPIQIPSFFHYATHLYLTLLKQLSHWKLKPPPASTWYGTIKDLTAKILIQPSTVPFAWSPHNYVRGRYYHLHFTERKTGTWTHTAFPWYLSAELGWKLGI